MNVGKKGEAPTGQGRSFGEKVPRGAYFQVIYSMGAAPGQGGGR